MFRADEISRLEAHAKAVLDRAREAVEFFDEARVLPRSEAAAGLMVWMGEVKWASGSDGAASGAASHAYDVWPLGESSRPNPYTDNARRIMQAAQPQPIFRGNAGKILKATNGSLCMYTRDGSGAFVLLCVFGETPQRRAC